MMTATKCPSEHQLKEMSLGRIDAEYTDEILAHVNSCDECQSNIETFDDKEDSLITSLRTPGELDKYQAETNCERALVKALGTLAHRDAEILSDELPDDLPDNLPKQLGEYELVRPLGRGGMGSVYLARHTKLGREVALKVLAQHRLGDSRMRQRFESEMQALGRLSHPNIVTAHDAREVAGTAVLVTEYINGFDLGQLLHRTGPLSIANACEIIRQVAVALQYASGQGFVHRDVKPSNIMLSRSGEVKLLDLGLARLLVSDTKQPDMTGTGQAMGSADYIAPEQVTDSRTVDVRADIYSLGCTLFKLLTGVAPFSGEIYNTAFAKMTAHVSTLAPSLAEFLPAAPKELVTLVDAMLAKLPAERPQTPREIAEQLQAFTAGKSGDPALVSLVEQATLTEPSAIPKVRTASSAITSNQASKPKSFFRRRVPIGFFIAAGLAGLALGFYLGVIVTIKYPDGTVVKHIVPDGGEVEIVANNPNDTQSSNALPRSTDLDEKPVDVSDLSSMPIFFGILTQKRPGTAPPPWENNPNGGPRIQDDGIWVRVDESVDTFHFGSGMKPNRYALIKRDADSIIPWSQLQGHLGHTTTAQGLTLNFDDDLSMRMQRFTKANLNRHLAIIVNGKIISAPKIVSPISDRALLSGRFTTEDIQFLGQALNGLVETSLQNDRGSSKLLGSADAGEGNQLEANPLVSAADASGGFGAEAGGDIELARKIEGIWTVISGKEGGHPININESAVLMAFKAGRFYLCKDKDIQTKGSYLLHSGRLKDPKFFIRLLDEDDHGLMKLGVLQFSENGELLLCFNESGNDWPTEFESKPDSPNDVLLELERLSNEWPMSNESLVRLLNQPNPALLKAVQAINKTVSIDNETTSASDQSDDVAKLVAARNHLKRFPLGFLNHASETGKFPASAGFSLIPQSPAANHPVSWRVAILPYIEQEELFKQYKLSEPWDSENNLKLLEKMPEFYRSPFAPDDQQPSHTNYQGFVGETTALGETDGVAISDILDGVSATVLIVDSKASVPWTKPTDFRFEKPEDATQAIPHDNQSLMIAMADGTVRSIANDDWELLAKLITRDGGETVNQDELK